MEKSIVSRTLSIHQEHELLLRLEGVGLTKELAQRVIENEELATKIIELMKHGGYKPTLSQKRAREIMSYNFLGVEEVAEHFGIFLTKEELTKVADIPFREKTLQECKDTHILFLGVNHDKQGRLLTIVRLREIFSTEAKPIISLDEKFWYEKKKFATQETLNLRWHLIRKSVLEESRRKSFAQQEKLLKENEYRERAVVYIYGLALMFKARGERIFQNDEVWCSDICSDAFGNYHVTIDSHFGLVGLGISARGDDAFDFDRRFGLAPARKPEI